MTSAFRHDATPIFACSRHDAPPDSVRIAVSGELDLATAPELDRALRENAHAHTLSLDLRSLTFIDCSSLAVLAAAEARSRASGDEFLILRGPPPVDRVFTLTGFEHRLHFAPAQDQQA